VEAAMKNLTITLPDELAQRIRVEAAKAGKSMSRYVAERLAEPVPVVDEAAARAERIAAINRFLDGPKWPLSDENGNLPSRRQYEDEGID